MRSTLYLPPGGLENIPEGTVLEDRPVAWMDHITINQIGHIRGCLKRGPHGVGEEYTPRAIFQHGHLGWVFSTGAEKGVKRSRKTVASMVMLAFVGPPPSPLHKAYFLDRDCNNHCLWNLEYLTMKEAQARGIITSHREMQRLSMEARKDKGKLKRQHPHPPPGIAGGMTAEEMVVVLSDFENGRKLRTIWDERFRQKTTFQAFRNQIYMLRKARRI